MPSGKHKSRTLRKVFRRTPGSKVVIQYKKRKPKKAVCAICGAILKGVARHIPSKLKNLSKSKKRPLRPFGGNLCSKCTKQKIIEESRKE